MDGKQTGMQIQCQTALQEEFEMLVSEQIK
jgi:hypothetical protein